MFNSDKRLTLVVAPGRRRSWNGADILFADTLAGLQETIAAHDVERIILDRSATADEFLYLLASLHAAVAGDVMSIRNDGGAFLSATGRGGDRVLYSLSPSDVGFYLQAHHLMPARHDLALIA